jgi:hypothetical protein
LGKNGGRLLRCAKCKQEWHQTRYPTYKVRIPDVKNKNAVTEWLAENKIPWTYSNERELEPPREGQEPEMEDILASIRRILSEDDDGYFTFWLYHKEDALLFKLIWA